MLQRNVVVGAVYQTRISGQLRPVRVLRAETHDTNRFLSARASRLVQRYRLEDKATGRILPKARPASALRDTVGAARARMIVQPLCDALAVLCGGVHCAPVGT